jgi:gamma-glutamyltranspeptidase/glutathione hydrolase
MLRRGGNAFDAVAAAGFASFVAEVTLTSAGGGGFLTGYRREAAEAFLLDFFCAMPGQGRERHVSPETFFPVHVNFGSITQVFHVGPASVAVPGSAAGLFAAHRHYGHLPVDAVIAPAVRLAREGVLVNRYQDNFFRLLRPILTLTEEGRSIFAPQGTLLKEGDRLYLKTFADTLEALAKEGPHLLYRGPLAERICRRFAGNGGLLSLEDLTSYEVMTRRPLRFDYRDHTLLTNPPPSAGGGLIALILKILEGVPFKADDFLATPAVEAQIAAMQVTNAVRARGYDQRVQEDAGLVAELLAAEPIDKCRRQMARLLAGESDAPPAAGGPGGPASTTHISVMDEMGNAASLTASNGEGSGIYIPDTGIMLNNMLGEEDLNPEGFHKHPPGRRISSMMAPTILLKDEEAVAVIGSGGSNRIRSAIFQAVMNLIDFGRSAEEAVNAPRMHWERGTLNMEPGADTAISPRLCPPAQRILWQQTNLFFGGVHAVTRDPAANTFSGAGDHRRGGVMISVE